MEKSNRQLKRIIQKQACNFINENVDDIILDADSTLVTTNGCQEAAAYISHYAEVGYHPLVINEFNTKLLVSSQLRAGSAYSSNGIIEELQGIFPYIWKDYRRVYAQDVIFRIKILLANLYTFKNIFFY